MKKRAGLLAGALGLLGALVVVWWLLQPLEPPPSVATEAPVRPVPTEVVATERPEAPVAKAVWRTVPCLLPVRPTYSGTANVLVEPPGSDPVWARGHTGPTVLTFDAPTPDGAGLVTIPGYARAGLIWFTDENGETDCYFPQDPKPVDHGRLRFPGPQMLGIDIRFSLGGSHVSEGQDWVEREFPEGPLEVQACGYLDYRLERCGPTETVQIVADQTTTWQPVLPPFRNDFFIEFEPHEEGAMVRYGTDEHAIEHLVLSADGVSTYGLEGDELEDLIAVVGGVEVEVGTEDGVRSFVLQVPR